VVPLLLIGAGVLAFAGGVLVVRSFGQAGRIGRIVAATRQVTIGEAARLAETADPPYVRVDGRIDAEDEFEDEAHRPLVLRLARLEIGRDGGWQTVESSRRTVPFGVRAGPDTIAIDGDALDEGLVVVPREAVGRAEEVPDRLPAGIAPDSPVRYVVRQVSSVEHAAVFGVPVVGTDGRGRMSAGRGRPLILTTLETDEALRLLGGGRRGRSALAIGLFVIGALAVFAGIIWALAELWLASVATALAASPTPTPAAGDPRSAGEGPGIVGEPLVAIAVVLAVGVVAALITMAWTRARPGPRADEQ
jgi:hypothetical protein